MKDRLITEIEQAMVASLDNAQMKLLHDVLTHAFWNKDISESEGIPTEQALESNYNLTIQQSIAKIEMLKILLQIFMG